MNWLLWSIAAAAVGIAAGATLMAFTRGDRKESEIEWQPPPSKGDPHVHHCDGPNRRS